MSAFSKFLLLSDLKLVAAPVNFHPEELSQALALYAVGRSQWLGGEGEMYLSQKSLQRLKQFIRCNLHPGQYLSLNRSHSLTELKRCAQELQTAFPAYQRWAMHELSLRRNSCLAGSEQEKQRGLLLVQPLVHFGQTPHEKRALRDTDCRSFIEFTQHYTQRRMRDEGIFTEDGFARFYGLLLQWQLAQYCRLG
ncbi:MAG: hypothetical protein MUC87_15910 [Bacteroidia bacterium]|jgi:hypothetical protein|nr:hypothetical protein [Bacteroidia bacterium]